MPIRLDGLDTTTRAIAQLRDGAGRFTGRMLAIGSALPYAYGIETGRHRDGRLARRAGGAHYLAAGLATARTSAGTEITAALPKGAGAVNLAMGRLGRRAQQRAQGVVPVRTGALRNSIRVVPGT